MVSVRGAQHAAHAVVFFATASAVLCSACGPEQTSTRVVGDASIFPTDHDAATHADGGLACTSTVAEWCALVTGGCITRWPDDPLSFCPTPAANGFGVWVGECGRYRVIRYAGVDISDFHYYDSATGNLIATVSHHYSGIPKARCGGGPTEFVEPLCPGDQPGMNLVCDDGGVRDGH